jgi:hypothetical protein
MPYASIKWRGVGALFGAMLDEARIFFTLNIKYLLAVKKGHSHKKYC